MKRSCKEVLFRDVVANLKQAGNNLCVLHGYEGYPEQYDAKKDIDVIFEDPAQVPRILSERKVASIVQVLEGEQDTSYVLHRQCDGRSVFLKLDVYADCQRKAYVFFRGEEFLKTSRTHEYFEIPSPDLEFTCYLLRRLMKGLNKAQVQRLSDLYGEDPSGCAAQLVRFFPQSEANLIAEAARSGDWEPVFHQIEHLRQTMLEKVEREQPWAKLRSRLGEIRAKIKARLQPAGLMVAFLGTDGVGKTTVSARVEQDLAPAFSSTKRYHRRTLSSALRWMERYRTGLPWAPERPHASVSAHAGDGQPAEPHTLSKPPRGLPASLLKLVLWWADITILGYLLDIYPQLVRSTLVLLDRYYSDLLVYPGFYRYGGPLWLARFVGHLIPHPHLTILLDAPSEIIQARKRELTFEETSRQREAYVKVVKGLANGHVVDASKPLDEVVCEVEEIILSYMAGRAVRKLTL